MQLQKFNQIKKMIPEGWDFVNFYDYVFFQEGPGLRNWQFKNKGMKVINVTNIVDGKLDLSLTRRHISLDEFKQKYSHFAIDENDIVVASSGNSYCKIGIVKKKDLPLMMNTSVIRLRPLSENLLDRKYLEFFLHSALFKNQIDLLITGAAQPNFGPYHLNKIRFLKPPLQEQQKIASILSNIDELIQKTEQIIEQTQRLKKGLMHRLLTRGIEHNEFEKVPWNYGKKIEIPKEWQIKFLDEVAQRGTGHTPDAKKPEYYNGGIKWVSLADSNRLDNIYISETTKEISEIGIKNSSAVKHPAGTVILSRDAGVGKSAILKKEMAVSQHFIAWRCREKLNNYFLYYLLQFWKPLFESIAIGTTIKTIGLPFFKNLRIPLPHIKEQQKIASILLNLDEQIQKLKKEKTNFEYLKKGLMQQLLTGKIRVKV